MAPTIDLDRPGPGEREWLAELRRRRVPRWLPLPGSRLVVVAPHPDDETLGAGGIISLLHRRGWEITVLALTDGEAAYDGPADLAEVRHAEQVEALGCLAPGSGSIRRLRLPDGGLSEVRDLPDRVAEALGPGSVCVAPWPGDGHPDHAAAGRAAAAAAAARGALFRAVPIWAWHWQAPATADFLDRACIVPLDELAQQRKAAAVAAYRSQTRPLGREPILPGHVLSRFARPFEVLSW